MRLMRALARHTAWLLALTISAPSVAATTAAATISAETPEGFSELASSRTVFLDVYFGDRKIGETFAVSRPGFLRFRAPGNLLSKLPDVIATPELTAALAEELPTNSQAVCSQTNRGSCGTISPQLLGIVYDEDRFRVDIFINTKFLRTSRVQAEGYLPIPSASLSLTNAFGVDASGTFGGSSAYNIQDRTVIAFHNARIRA